MTSQGNYTFRAVEVTDLDLLATWQSRPHVRKWWEDGEPFDEDDIRDPRVSGWIISASGVPFAFMQDYEVHGWDVPHFAHLPGGARGIDQYIADPEMIGQGHGPAFIAARLRALYAKGVPAFAVDPHPENIPAIRAYEKLGFAIIGSPLQMEWGLIVPMTLLPEQATFLS